MSGKLTMECPRCRRTMTDLEREELDPPSAVKVVLICPDCDDGDFHSPHYFDASGGEVLWFAGRSALAQSKEEGNPHDR